MVFPAESQGYIGSDSAPTAHISIATAWHTAYDVRNFQTTRHKCYFVQDYEPWFFPAGSLATFAEETYRFGFTGITAGTWLADMLHRDFGMTTHAVSSYDRELYRVLPRKNPETKRTSSSTRVQIPPGARLNWACWYSPKSPSATLTPSQCLPVRT